jgi:hypothetical protein
MPLEYVSAYAPKKCNFHYAMNRNDDFFFEKKGK